jgi:predicted secreted hydrolase
MRLVLPGRTLQLEPLFDDQEIDARQSTGTVYWEGAVRVTEGRRDGSEGAEGGGRRAGLGYLELTGYHSPLRL